MQLLLNVNVVAPVAPQYSLVAFFDLVHAVTFSTTCDLDFQPYEGNHCKPTIVEINIASEKINQSNFSKKIIIAKFKAKLKDAICLHTHIDHSIRRNAK